MAGQEETMTSVFGRRLNRREAMRISVLRAGVLAIIINAINPDALVPTVNKARQQGIVVVAFDNIVNSDQIVFVNEDQVLMGKNWAEFLVQQMGGSGKVLMVNGVAGTSVDA